LALVGCVYAYFNLIEPDVKKHVVRKLSLSHMASVLKQRSILLLVLPWLVIYMIIGNFFAFMPKAGGQDFGIEGWLIGAVMATATIAVVLFQRGYGALSDKVGRMKVMVVGVVGIVGLLMMFAVVYASIPNFDAEPVEETIVFENPGAFENGIFTTGNGILDVDSVISLEPGEVVFVFGPIEFEDTNIGWVRADWTGDNSTLTVRYTMGDESKDHVLTPGRTQSLKGGPKNVTFIVRLGPGEGSHLKELEMDFEHSALPPDIVNELIDRPCLVGTMALFGILAGAFAPAALAGLADECHMKQRGVTMSIYIVMIGLGQVIGPPITGWLMDHHGPKGFLWFLIASGITLMVIMVAKWLDKRSKKRAGEDYCPVIPEDESCPELPEEE
jgi:nitrate/nitrite transporter NarK